LRLPDLEGAINELEEPDHGAQTYDILIEFDRTQELVGTRLTRRSPGDR
jgi:hypothetical protein